MSFVSSEVSGGTVLKVWFDPCDAGNCPTADFDSEI